MHTIIVSLFLVLVTFLSPSVFGQQELDYHETLGDPYLPNNWGNKNTSPAYKYSGGKGVNTGGSNIFTIQVNVNGSGQNILGDAANETSIAINPLNPNEMVIGWRQFDNVASNFRQAGWGYTTNAGASWTFPGKIEAGIFRSDPVLDYDKNGAIYYNSLTLDAGSNFLCKVFKSSNGGISWDPGTDAFGGDKQWMTVDRTNGVGSGNIYANWNSNFTSCTPGFFTRSTNGGASYENCIPVDGNPYWGANTVGNNGELYIAGENLVVKSVNAQTPGSAIVWETYNPNLDGVLVSSVTINPVGLLGQCSIDVDRSNGPGRDNVYVLASVQRNSISDPGDVMFTKSTDGGVTWSPAMRVNDDNSITNTQWFGTMSTAPNGRIDAIWLDTRDATTGSDSSALYYAYSIDQGNGWSANQKMSISFDPHVGYPNQNKMGDYFDMISDDAGVHIAWANTFNGEEDVYYSYITVPANIGIDEPFNNLFQVFPNPTDGIVNISSNTNLVQVDMYTIQGKQIFSTTNPALGQIDISTEPAGIYFIKASGANGKNAVKKIIKY